MVGVTISVVLVALLAAAPDASGRTAADALAAARINAAAGPLLRLDISAPRLRLWLERTTSAVQPLSFEGTPG